MVPFPDAVKRKVERAAHFRCCICKEFGVEIHHIIPQSEAGRDTEDNAAPLCPRCHDIYGANPEKRRVIRDARDLWYELCGQRYKPDDLGELQRLNDVMLNAATKDDL